MLERSSAAVARSLVERIAAGDAAAERELWLGYARGLRFIVRQRCGDDELAQDVVQDAFRIGIAHLRKGRLANPDALGAFLRGIALNVLSERQRRGQREVQLADDQIEQCFAADERLSPFEATSRDERCQLVRRLIAELEVPRDRLLLWRHYVLEHDKRELCEELGLSVVHFDRVLHRAKQRLRQLAEHRGMQVSEA